MIEQITLDFPFDQGREYRWRYPNGGRSAWRSPRGGTITAPPGACGLEWRSSSEMRPTPWLDWSIAKATVKPAHEVY